MVPEVAGASPDGLAGADAPLARFGAVVPVLGAHAQAGASGVALGLAEAAALAGFRVLLVDSADPGRSGLAGVCHVEGRSMPVGSARAPVRVGIRCLGRATVDVRRLAGAGAPLAVSQVPLPPEWAQSVPNPVDLTVVDVGWDLWRLMTARTGIGPLTWCHAPIVSRPVLVVRATVPAVCLAEAVIGRYRVGQRRIGLTPLAGLVVVGVQEWPTQVRAALGYLMWQATQNALFVPYDAAAAVGGWSTEPVPAAVTAAAAGLLRGLGGRFAEAVGPPAARRGRLSRRS